MKTLWLLLAAVASLLAATITVLVASSGPEKTPVAVAFGLGVWLLTGAYPLYRFFRPPPAPSTDRVHHDDEASPVPWIADAAWRSRNDGARYPSVVGIHDQRQAEGAGILGDDVDVGYVESSSLPRRREARAFSARHEVEASTLAEKLRGTPNILFQLNAFTWPACCGDLMTLLVVQPSPEELATLERGLDGSLDRAVQQPLQEAWRSELTDIRANKRSTNGIHIFECRSCTSHCGVLSHT